MRTFYRIETINMDEGYSVGGYMAAVDALLCKKLGIEPNYTAEELHIELSKSKDPDVRQIMVSFAMLCDILIPEVHRCNKDNTYCLYFKEEFDEAVEILNGLRNIMIREMPAYTFRYKTFKLNNDEITYEDPYQIVITKEVYEKHKNDSKYKVL